MIDLRQLRELARTLAPERPDEAALIRDAAFEIAVLRAKLRLATRDGDTEQQEPRP